MDMTGRRITDAELESALRTLVGEGDTLALRDRVLRAIASADSRARSTAHVARIWWLPRAAFAGGAVSAMVLLGLVLLNQDVSLPGPPSSPAFTVANGAAPLPAPVDEVPEPAVVRVGHRAAPPAVEPSSAPLIDPVPPPAPIEIHSLQMAPIEDSPLQIQALTVEPLSIPPLDGD
jgi:hypothetical protein